MIRSYAWKVPVAATDTVEAAGTRLRKEVKRIVDHPFSIIVAGEVDSEPDHLFMRLRFKGRDRWDIRKKYPFLVASILRKSQVDHQGAELVDADLPVEDRRSTRLRASDGRHNAEPDDDVARKNAGRSRRGCAKCKEVTYAPDPVGGHAHQS